MRKVLGLISVGLFWVFSGYAQQTVFVPTCSGTNDTAAFTNIKNTIGSNEGTIRIPYKALAGQRCAVNTLSLPSNITIDNSDGTGIKVNTGQTLTVAGPRVNPSGKTMFFNVAGGQGTLVLTGGQYLTSSNLSVAPVSPSNPMAVGDNDRRMMAVFNVQAYGAVGDGVTNDRTAIQAADTAAAAVKGAVYFPATANFYLTNGSLRPSSGTTWFGDGYGSQIKCPSIGWLLVATTNMGIINIDNKTNVRVTGLRLTGTKVAPTDGADAGFPRSARTPKLIYLHESTGLKIDHSWFDNTYWQGIWSGGTGSLTGKTIVEVNHFYDIGYDTGAAAPAIQINGDNLDIIGNVIETVGSGISASGVRNLINANIIRDITGNGIGTGDAPDVGLSLITANNIQFAEAASTRRGIQIDGGSTTNRSFKVANNFCHLVGSSLGTGVCYYVGTAKDVQLDSNTSEIEVLGTGFDIRGSTAGTTVVLNNNTVKVFAESGVSSGFKGRPDGVGQTLNLYSSGNKVFGMTRAQGSYAYDYLAVTGTLTGGVANDWKQQGYARFAGTIYGDTFTPTGDLVPLYDDLTVTSFSAFIRYPQLSLLNIGAALETKTIASGVIALAGTSGIGFPHKQTSLKFDTEGGAASDDLDTVSGGTTGDILIIQSAASARDVVIKNGTGNIFCGADFTLATTRDRIVLMYDGTNWNKLSSATN